MYTVTDIVANKSPSFCYYCLDCLLLLLLFLLFVLFVALYRTYTRMYVRTFKIERQT